VIGNAIRALAPAAERNGKRAFPMILELNEALDV
jgi:hypothetical protein